MNAGEILSLARRRHARISQEELSRRTGISQATISRYETGAVPDIPFSTLLCLLQACGYRLTVRLDPVEETRPPEFTA